MDMPVQARKPLEEIAGSSGKSSTSPSMSDRILRSQSKTSPQSGQRSVSPNKKSPSLYPDLGEAKAAAGDYRLYPSKDLSQFNESFQSTNETELNFTGIDESLNDTLPSVPLPPVRRRKNIPGSQSEKTDAVSESQAVKAENPLSIIYLLLIVLGLLFVVVFFFYVGFKPLPEFIKSFMEKKDKTVEFEKRYKDFKSGFHERFNDESLHSLHAALKHHVRIAKDDGQKYPTCVLLAGDEKEREVYNDLAKRIAHLVPGSTDAQNRIGSNVHFVDLSDKSVNHKKPDEEDLRSRVHHGISSSLNKGADVFVFNNLDALAQEDVPLLNLFYSYCDGENPTFPKTLWILTMATKGLGVFESKEKAKTEEFHREAGKAVERYLENFIENTPQSEDVTRYSRNPLLTRIANHIIPVVPAV